MVHAGEQRVQSEPLGERAHEFLGPSSSIASLLSAAPRPRSPIADGGQRLRIALNDDVDAEPGFHLPGGADGIAADATGVWVMDRSSGTVVRIDPTSEDVGQQIRVGADPTSIAVGEGFVWVSDLGDGAVYRVDPGGLESTAIPVGDDPGPGDVSVGEGGVWATSG